MSESTSARTTVAKTDTMRVAAVIVAFAVTIGMVLIGSGALGGTPTSEAAGGALSATATPLAPATTAFSIWSLIYVGLAALTVWHALPSRRSTDRLRAIGWLLVPAMLLNGLWLLVAQAGVLWLTVVVMLALLGTLLAILMRLQRRPARGAYDRLITDGTIGLYLGWVSVATVANIASWLADAGVRPEPFEPWAIAALAIAACAGAGLAVWSGGRIAPSLAMAWGLAWIAVGRLATEPHSTATAIAAIAAAVVIAIVTVVARARRARSAAAA